jgi:hypothetical protein
MEERKLIRAYDVGRRLGYTTATVKSWARSGKLPGAVFIGNPGRQHIRFDPRAIEEFIAAGGQRPELPAPPKQAQFSVRRHGHRTHAGGQPRNDRSRRDPAKALADLVKPDPGVRDFDPMAEAPDLARVPAARYLPGGSAQV